MHRSQSPIVKRASDENLDAKAEPIEKASRKETTDGVCVTVRNPDKYRLIASVKTTKEEESMSV